MWFSKLRLQCELGHNKSQAQISILALLLSSGVHRKTLLKVLTETCVPTSAIESSFEGMVSTVLATNQISFTNDELPPEGREPYFAHAHHGKVWRYDCVQSTIEHLNVDNFLIRPTTMFIRAFDGTLREV